MAEGQEHHLPQRIVQTKAEVVSKNTAGRPFGKETPQVSRREQIGQVVSNVKKLITRQKIEETGHVPISVGGQLTGKEARYTRLPGSGRSIEDRLVDKKIIYGDEYGILYGSRNIKGNVVQGDIYQRSAVFEDENTPYGLQVRGLKDKVGIDRIVKASEYLRKQGLPTERPAKIYKLTQIPYQGKMINIEDWKEEYLKRELQRANKFGIGSDFKTLRNKESYLRSTDFFVIDRDLQVPERLDDIIQPETQEEFQKMIQPIFKWLNQAVQVKHGGLISGTPQPAEFNPENEDDIKRFFGEWLPTQIGTYLGRVHKNNLALGYPHNQNWSAVGTAYDLDSVQGQPFDGKIPTQEQFSKDVYKTIEAVKSLFESSPLSRQSYIQNTYSELLSKSVDSFIVAYLQEKIGKIDLGDEALIQSVGKTTMDRLKARFAPQETKTPVVEGV